MDGEKIVKSIAWWTKRRHSDSTIVDTVVDDLESSTEGYMNEEEIGAMIVDLLTEVVEEKQK